jgi:hypothetical protein
MRMDASWSGRYGPTGYKVAARVARARQRTPLGPVTPTTTSVAAVLGSIKARPETIERKASTEQRPALTVPARAGLQTLVGRGEETGFQVEQRNEGIKKVKKVVNVVEIVLDFEGLIQGLLRLYSRYGPPGCSTAFTAAFVTGSRSRNQASPNTWSSDAGHRARDGSPSCAIMLQILPPARQGG